MAGVNGRPVLLPLVGLHVMLHKPIEITKWVVDERIPVGSVCLLVAKPKVGKTTAARHLAVAVARGDEWLGSQCRLGVVWYLALEGREADHLSHFRQLGLTDEEAARVRCYIGPAKPGLLATLMSHAKVEPPSLIIVDTLQRLLQVKSMDDYAEVTKAFDPVIACARETGAALLLIHHAGKISDRDALDTVLGSTAIAGSVDNTIILSKLKGFRTVTTRQRVGADLDECVIRLGADGRVVLGEARSAAELRAMMDLMYRALANCTEKRLLAQQWLDLVDGRKQTCLRAMRALVADGSVTCVGAGTKNSPWVYSVSSISGTATPLQPTQADVFSV